MTSLPNVSIVTPTYGHRNLFKLAIINFMQIDYPTNKLEWIIIDEGKEPIKDLLPNDNRIKYYYFDEKAILSLYEGYVKKSNEKKKAYKAAQQNNRKQKVIKKWKPEFTRPFKRIPMGIKRNICAAYATSDYIVHMDDDDYYPRNSVSERIHALLDKKVNCVACTSWGAFHTGKMISVIYQLQKGVSFSVGTLAYTKQFWQERRFNTNDRFNEGEKFLKGRECKIIPWENVIVQLFHQKNERDVNAFHGEPNGWHFEKLPDEIFNIICNIDPSNIPL